MAIKLQYALNQDKEPVSITNETVQSRAGQIYHCPDPYCAELVIPKKGEVNQHHFSHKSGSGCYGPESSLHLPAKEAFLLMDTFKLPHFYYSPHEYFLDYKTEIEDLGKKRNFSLPEEFYLDWNFDSLFPIGSTPNLFDARNIDLKEYQIVIENYQGKIKPDIRIIDKKNPEKQLLIEIAVTHKIDKNKQVFVENNNLALIEVDLSSFYRTGEVFSVEEVKSLIADNPYKTSWKNITQKSKLLQLKKAEVLAVVENKLTLIEKIYQVIVEEYLEPNSQFVDDEEYILETIQKSKFYRDEEEKMIFKNELLLSFFIKTFKEGPIYAAERQKRILFLKMLLAARKPNYK